MSELFLNVITMSISASWLVPAVLVFRIFLKKSPKWVTVLLWGIVAVRMICPFTMESSFSLIPEAIGRGELVSEWMEHYVGNVDSLDSEAVSYDESIGAAREPMYDGEGGYYVVTKQDQLGEPATVENTLMPVLSVVWAVGMAFLVLYTVISYCRVRGKVDTAVLYRDNIFQSENIRTPFVLGMIKPKIYLPFQLQEQELEYVVAHEQAHISRKDHWWKPFGFLLLTIHWFNPLMWVSYVLLCRDIELACDEKVIRKLDREQRADYTQALVACSVKQRRVAACPLAFGEVGVKERVRSVMNYKKPTFWMLLLCLIGCIVMAACFLTDPKKETFRLRIVVPAGSQAPFVYADEEISPLGNTITITSGDGLGDTEVVLKTVQVRTETAYEPTYLTPGMPVRMEAEKGGWFQLGVNMQNNTAEDKIVYVNVKNVEVRISDESTPGPTNPQETIADDSAAKSEDKTENVESSTLNDKEDDDPDLRFLTREEIEQVNAAFAPIILDKQGNAIGTNVWSCFFTSYYEDVRGMDFAAFLAYFPGDGSKVDEAEFGVLKEQEDFPFGKIESLGDMPVPVHKYPVRIINLILKEYAGITVEDLDTSGVNYLSEYDAFYNYTSDAGFGMFTCTSGEIDGDVVRLYEEFHYGTDVLTLKKVEGRYRIVSHQQVENR